jgi:hypothetical protein
MTLQIHVNDSEFSHTGFVVEVSNRDSFGKIDASG